jgi:hypothetical protein
LWDGLSAAKPIKLSDASMGFAFAQPILRR